MDLLTAVDPTSASSSDPYHPSFFELAAQEQLRALIKPAARYVLSVLAQRNPRYLLRVVNRFDEVYAAVLALVENHYLRVWGSSFTENFYGLKRRRRPGLARVRAGAGAGGESESLREQDVRRSLLVLVGLPYLGAKLDDWWERNGGGVDDGLFAFEAPDEATRTSKVLVELFKRTYPYAKTAWHVSLLGYNIAYLFDKTPYWRPWLALMRVDIRRMGAGDGPRKPLLPTRLPALSSPLRWLRLAASLLFESLKYALPASIFFFKFLEWWYGADNPRRRTHASNTTPLPPPKPLPPNTQTTIAHNTCPICSAAPINNPALLPSGYVTCYTCAHTHLQATSRCPVTNLPIPQGTDALRKVLA